MAQFSALVLVLSWPCEGGAIAGNLRIKRQNQFNSVPALPTGPGSARSLFDQIVNKINQGHRHQQDLSPVGTPQQIAQVRAPIQNAGIPQSQPCVGNQFDNSFNTIPTQPQNPSFVSPFQNLNSNPVNEKQNKVPFPQTKAILPNFTPNIAQGVQISTPTQNLGLALFNKESKTAGINTASTIFDALEAQAQEEKRLKVQEQVQLANIANIQRQQEMEEIRLNRIRQEEAFRIQEERAHQEKVFKEQLLQETLLIQQQRQLEERVNNERLQRIEKERFLELQESKRRKQFLRLSDRKIGFQEHLDERRRFSAHKAIANTFRKNGPVPGTIIGLSGLQGGRFETRPEPV